MTFAALHVPGRPLVLPNAWDVASGLLLARQGAAAVGTTSLGVTAAAGLPDGAGEGRELTVALARRLAPRLGVPLTVDLEGGYSDDPAAVADLVAELGSVGVAGVNLEDGLRPVEVHAAIVRAAAATGVFVNARTDTYWAAGDPTETLPRLLAYRDAGAGGVFVPGLTDPTAIGALVAAVELPLNVLWHSSFTVDELASLGVARISTGSLLYRTALGAALSAVPGAAPVPTPAYADVAGC